MVSADNPLNMLKGSTYGNIKAGIQIGCILKMLRFPLVRKFFSRHVFILGGVLSSYRLTGGLFTELIAIMIMKAMKRYIRI